MKTKNEYFSEFLNFFWLRPENALLQAVRAEKYAVMYAANLQNKKAKAIDVSCGDGVFSFITFGGELAPTTDMFRSIDLSKERTEKFDAFDYYDESYQVTVSKEPFFKFHTGTDWKSNLLKKAAKLNFYGQLLHHDNNLRLPLEDNSYDFTFSNSAYWVKNFEAHLQDLVRITKPGGLIVLELKMSDIIADHTAINYAAHIMGTKFAKIIDAGRIETWRGLRTRQEIDQILRKLVGCRVMGMQPMYGGIIARIWDIGLRPLFNPLAKMANNLNPEVRLSVKEEWCAIIRELCSELLDGYKADEKDAIEWIITLEKTA